MKKFLFVMFIAALFVACAPRSSTMCLKYYGNSDTATWVKCPKGTKPGSYLNKPIEQVWKKTY